MAIAEAGRELRIDLQLFGGVLRAFCVDCQKADIATEDSKKTIRATCVHCGRYSLKHWSEVPLEIRKLAGKLL